MKLLSDRDKINNSCLIIDRIKVKQEQPTSSGVGLQIAADKGRTRWLQNLLTERLPELNRPEADYQNWFNSVIEFMVQRGLTEPTQQKDYISDIRNAIKVIDPNHPALEIVDFNKETWTEINNHYSDRIANRRIKFLDNPDAIVNRATILLKSYQWSEIAAGLAVVTGRRCTEVIKTANFEYKSLYSVIFTGAIKRGDEPVECVFEIPTLCEARLVIEGISSLRNQLGEEINSLSKRQVSRRYGKGVATKCDRYFSELVPPREDKDNLYTHLFRAVYATIASYWYCPPTVPEMEFRAAIQGHYQILDENNPQLRRSIAASRNYFDYKISDGRGNVDGRLGIKLSLPDVEVVEQFQHLYQPDNNRQLIQDQRSASEAFATVTDNTSNEPKVEPATQTDTPIYQTKSSKYKSAMNEQTSGNVAIPSFFLSRLKAISNRLELNETETIEALFIWAEMGLTLAENLKLDDATPQAVFDRVEELKQMARTVPTLTSTTAQVTDSQNLNNESGNRTLFSPEAVAQICTSVRLLTEALSIQQNNNNYSLNSSDDTEGVNSQALPLKNRERADRPRRKSIIQQRYDRAENNNFADSTESEENKSIVVDGVNELDSLIIEDKQPQARKQSSKNKKKITRSIEAEQSVDRAINAIMEFNDAEGRKPDEKWYIGVGSIKQLSGRAGTVFKRVYEKRKDEIEEHHQKHQLGKWHNARGAEYPSIDEVIHFER